MRLSHLGLLTITINEIPDGPTSRPNQIGGVPVVISDCSGWLHWSPGDIGVVLCSGIGRDAHVSYTTLRRLALELAQAGYSTLRFDYPGTGDSKDVQDIDPALGWRRGVDDAIGFMRGTGVRRIIVCGYRLGALFSLLNSADHQDVDDVVMIDPVISGASFLREVGISASLGGERHNSQSIEVDGYAIASGRRSPLHAMNALSLEASPAKRLLILTPGSSRQADRLADRMRKLGLEVTQANFTPIREFDRDGYVGRTVDLDAVRQWLPPVSKLTGAPPWVPSQETLLTGDDFVERPLHFADGLFGVLCRPPGDDLQGRVVLLGNCGSSPRYGPARFHVFLARQLAAAGIASLRFDFAGLGESSSAGSDADTHIYETGRSQDVGAAIDALESLGHRGFIAAGVCSGGYHAWLATLDDARIGAVLMVNPAVFAWRKGQSLDALIHTGSRSTRSYLATMSNAHGWKRLVSRHGLRRAVRTARVVAARRLTTAVGHGAALVGLPVRSSAPFRAMQGLSRRGARVLVIMAAGDAGLDLLTSHFGSKGRRLAKLPGVAVKIMSNIDHAVTRRAMQRDVADVVLEFLNLKVDQPAMPMRRTEESLLSVAEDVT